MSSKLKNNAFAPIIAADFETTVYEGQTSTEVWAAGYAELYTSNVIIRGCMEDFLNDLYLYGVNILCWFHNLKFDGSFIIDWLLRHNWKYDKPSISDKSRFPRYHRTFRCLISSKNKFYVIQLRYRKQIITFYDSVKLFPFTLADAAKAFNTEHKKLDMVYEGKRYPNCPRTVQEDSYIRNDVLVLKEILEIFYNRGHTRMTIGSNCVHYFKNLFEKYEYNALFPDLKSIKMEDSEISWDNYVRKTYRGAFCYVKEPGEYYNGATFDVNSLYPFVMHGSSGNYYPVGYPHYFKGEIPEICDRNDIVWFIHIKCKFKLKLKHLPTIQIKNSFLYNPREFLKTSNFIYHGKEYEYLVKKGEKYYAYPELYLTMKDYELLLTHYDVTDLEIIDGCWFTGQIGLFDDYINVWMEQKENAKNKVERTESKLFLNNLYGKFATSDDSSYQIPFIDENDRLAFELITEHNKDVMYIPAGSMITAYARYYTITHAQINYDNFCYADTDSLHCINPDEIKSLKIHPTKLGYWDRECDWSKAIFIRAKTYAEFIRKESGEKVYPHWKITCAGMPERSKKIFLAEHPITDFKYGLTVRGKLVPKRIKGGIILEEKNFTLRKLN